MIILMVDSHWKLNPPINKFFMSTNRRTISTKERTISFYEKKDIKELWIEDNVLSFPEVSFEVLKLHHIFNKSQQRILKFTK